MPKKVIILSAFLSPLRSGAEACAEEFSVELSDQYDIMIITARMQRSLPRRDHLQGKVAVLRLGLGFRFDKWLYPFLAPIAVLRYRPDLVHAVLESFAGMALIFCRLVTRAPRILTCQSTNTNYKGKVSSLRFVRMMHKSADHVTVISRMLQERAKQYGRDDAVLIPNGLRLRDIPQREKVFGRVLFVGRLEPMKGVDTLLKAFQELPAHGHLHIVGEGSLRQDLEIQKNMLGLEDRVTFLGYVPTPDVYEEFAEAEIFCGLSRHEAFGNVFAEAQAAGCAVVGTEVEGIPDIVTNGETGFLVEPDYPDGAHDVLKRLLEDASLRQRLAEAGQRNAQQYDWSFIAERYGEVYAAALENSSPPPSGRGSGRGDSEEQDIPAPLRQAQDRPSPLPMGEGR